MGDGLHDNVEGAVHDLSQVLAQLTLVRPGNRGKGKIGGIGAERNGFARLGHDGTRAP